MNRTIIALCVVPCVLLACSGSLGVRRAIEKHLGLSAAGVQVLDEALSHPPGNAPDMGA